MKNARLDFNLAYLLEHPSTLVENDFRHTMRINHISGYR